MKSMYALLFRLFLRRKATRLLLPKIYDSALKALKSSRLDVVVSDIIMGQKTGIDLLREIKEKRIAMPGSHDHGRAGP